MFSDKRAKIFCPTSLSPHNQFGLLTSPHQLRKWAWLSHLPIHALVADVLTEILIQSNDFKKCKQVPRALC